MDFRTDQEGIRLMLGASTDNDTNTYIECNDNTNNTTLFKPVHFKDTLILDNDTITMPINSNGLIMIRNSGNAWPTLTIKDGQGQWRCLNRKFNCLSAGNVNNGTEMVLQETPNNDNR